MSASLHPHKGLTGGSVSFSLICVVQWVVHYVHSLINLVWVVHYVHSL